MYGVVPPVADAEQETAVPTVPVAGQLIDAARASGEIVTTADADAVCEAESVTVTDIVSVPFVE